VTHPAQNSIAIVGLAIRAPGAPDAATFFSNLREGVDSISRFTREQQESRGVPREILDDPRYVPAGGVLEGIDLFDAALFGLSAREAELTDPQQRIFLEIVWQAFEDAGVDPFAADSVTGLFAGCSLSRYLMLHALPQVDAIGSVTNLLALAGNDKDHLATRTAYLLNLRGPCLNVQTSCSTSLAATHLACQSLLSGECDCAVAGASSIQLPQGFGYFHEPGGITSPDGFCRPFDDSASGTVFGSGAGAVVLKRAEDALAHGDRIYALIRGTAVYNDGATKAGYSAPAHAGQVRTVASALAVSGVEPASVGYMECHGTGTALGDPIEIAALTEAFGPCAAPCWIGSAKGNVGHLECASGIAGLIKTALALHRGFIPPSLHFAQPNRRIGFESGPFRVIAEGRAWTRGSRPRYAGVHSLGLGGTNAHLILEEAPLPQPRAAARERVLHISARDADALRDLGRSYESFLRQQDAGLWPYICAASRLRRASLPERLAIEANSCAEAAVGLRQWREGIAALPNGRGSLSESPSTGSHCAHIDLPAYPMRRKRYWLDRSPARGRRSLLGVPRTTVFEIALSRGNPPWLRDHLVNGTPVLPGAAIIEMALSAAQRSGFSIADAEFLLPLPVDNEVVVQTRIEWQNDGTASWEICSVGGEEPRLNARGRLCPISAPGSLNTLAGSANLSNGDASALYARAAAAGVEYSGCFRAIRSWHSHQLRAWADLALPAELDVWPYTIHPALLDACWQVAGALIPESGGVWVPSSVARVAVYRDGLREGRCDAELSGSNGNWTAGIRLWSPEGALVAAIEGLCFRQLPVTADRPPWLYEPVWEEQPLTLDHIGASLRERIPAISRELALTRIQGLRERMETASAMFATRLFDGGRDLAVLPQYRRLLSRLSKLPANREDEGAAFCRKQAQLYPEVAAQWRLLEECGSSLGSVLRGEIEPLALLFGDGSAADIYASSPYSRLLNTLLAEAVGACVATGGVRRILEVGAGTGASTESILPGLDTPVEYWLTDMAPSLVERARTVFPSAHSAVLDISRDPLAQGFEAARFDLLIAAHVLHATPDLRQTLRHIRGLLRPGGRLLALETVEPQSWLDLTFGLTKGWWNGTDDDLRGGYPLLGPEAWTRIFQEEGFASTVIRAGEGTALLMAETAAPSGDWLLLGPKEYCSELAGELERRGNRVHFDDPSNLSQDVEVVDMRPLAAPREDASAGARELCAGALDLVQTLAEREGWRLWILTRQAQPVTGEEWDLDPAAAALWGLSVVIRQELPALHSTCLDLPVKISWPDIAAELVAGRAARSCEGRVAFRGERRLVNRLRPAPARDLPASWRRPRRAPGSGEVEIEVLAAGINFRDVLRAAGAYPDAGGDPGGECSGRISSVGPGVTGLSIGDEVVAAAEGSLAAHVTAKAALVARKPPELAWTTAAGIPIAWMTAAWSLEKVAKLQTGNTVLIHAGAGGVGLAAIEIARAAGARVFATAGSPAKRDFLRERVERVFDSRSVQFREGVLSATGGRGADVVLNCLAGELIAAGFDALAAGGRFLEIGRIGAWSAERARAYRPDVQYEVIGLDRVISSDPAGSGLLLERLLARIAAGELRTPPIHSFFPWEESTAFAMMRQARHTGKIVLQAPPRRFVARPDATYLITGGTSGLGLRTAHWLVERGARHLILAGTRGSATDIPEGAEVRALDTRDSEAIRELLRDIDRRMPPLAGVIHAAGILRDRTLAGFAREDFDEVLLTKVSGAWALHRALAGKALDFFVCYSSAGALLGSAGQANHAAANAFLDTLCHSRRHAGRAGLTVNWGAWNRIGSAASDQIAERLAAHGIARIDPNAGLAALEALLCDGYTQALGFPADWSAYFDSEPDPPRLLERQRPSRRAASAAGAGGPAPRVSLRERTAALPGNERRAFLINAVRTEAAGILGVGSRAPDADRPLGDAGLDSLMAIELRRRLTVATELPLPVTLLFNHPTAEAIADYLMSQMYPVKPETEPGDAEDRLAALLANELREIETI